MSDIEYYRALDMLMDDKGPLCPLLYGGKPFWKPAAPPIVDQVRIPDWGWEYPVPLDAGTQLVSLDVSAAFLSAASSAQFAHGGLVDTGTRGEGPGYYLVDAHHWNDHRIVSPLGNTPMEGARVWVKYPTLHLLRGLAALEHAPWPDVIVYGSWTCPKRVDNLGRERGTTFRMRKWVEAIQKDRAAVMADIADDPCDEAARKRYDMIKDGYSIAIEMMAGAKEGKKIKANIRRPDWTHTIRAQHAASHWRRCYGAVLAGHGPISMGATDEVAFTMDDFNALMKRASPVFRFDPTGVGLGTLKIKEVHEYA
jgi:hypothetical protein